MSYDLMVFEKVKAPKTRKEFLEWYEKQTELVFGNERNFPTNEW